ncbi:MAG: HD domain-containing protein [Mogibacterium sp.]|nr:HD domain-containing protein [Mogibacterium sp.]
MSITREEQQSLFREFETPKHVQAHCNAVARTAKRIAEALNEHGYHLDVDLIYGAALVHDVLRVQKEHDLRGAELLESRNHPEEADLVRMHMRYNPFSPASDLHEIDILCLADRTVLEDQFVGIDKRMDYLLQKKNFPEDKKPYIDIARQQGLTFVHEIEEIIGMTLEELLRAEPETGE